MDRIEAPQPELIVPNFPRTTEGGTPERIRTPTTVVRGHVHSSVMLQAHINSGCKTIGTEPPQFIW